jgi:hypothetical protein
VPADFAPAGDFVVHTESTQANGAVKATVRAYERRDVDACRDLWEEVAEQPPELRV